MTKVIYRNTEHLGSRVQGDFFPEMITSQPIMPSLWNNS